MLRDRYDRVDLFALVPQLGLPFEPQLTQLDRLLDDDEIFARVRADLGRRYPWTPVHGRRSTAVETNIHYPTDSGLLSDGVRVLSRLLKRAQKVLGKAAHALGSEAFRSRVRTV